MTEKFVMCDPIVIAAREARLAALREVREHFMAWHRLELGLLIDGSREAAAITKIFAIFLNQIDTMIAKEEGG